MVEVFKTDVEKKSQARLLADLISLAFTGYQASFDLEDCDKVLRICCEGGAVCHVSIIGLLESFGYEAAVLGEESPRIASTAPIVNTIHSITM